MKEIWKNKAEMSAKRKENVSRAGRKQLNGDEKTNKKRLWE